MRKNVPKSHVPLSRFTSFHFVKGKKIAVSLLRKRQLYVRRKMPEGRGIYLMTFLPFLTTMPLKSPFTRWPATL